MEGESRSPISEEGRAWLRQMAATAPAGPAEVRQLVQLFIDDGRSRVADLHRAAGDAELAVVRGHAHDLRGSSATFGADDVAEICRRLDALAGTGDVGAVRAAISTLDAAMTAAAAALAAEFLAAGDVSSPIDG